jgi:hypothetical protein
MLLQGIDHVATITNDGDRLKKFYVDTFAEIRERLIAAGASDRVVTEFGRKLSIFFRDPDQMEGEVLVSNPDADPDNLQFGTPSPRFS